MDETEDIRGDPSNSHIKPRRTIADELDIGPSERMEKRSSRFEQKGDNADSRSKTSSRFASQAKRRSSKFEPEPQGAEHSSSPIASCNEPANNKAQKGSPERRSHRLRGFAVEGASTAKTIAGRAVMDEDERDAEEAMLDELGDKSRFAASSKPRAGAVRGRTKEAAKRTAQTPSKMGKAPVEAQKESLASRFWKHSQWKRQSRATTAAATVVAKGNAATTAAATQSVGIKARLGQLFRRLASGSKAPIVLAFILVFAALMTASMAMTAAPIVGGIGQTLTATSYDTPDADILAIDAAYTQLEAGVESQAQGAASSHPGYDEYRYQLDEVGHDPFALASILTARYGTYDLNGSRSFLSQLISTQYSISYTPSTETVETTDEDGNVTQTQKRILSVTLTNKGLAAAANSLLTSEELAHYEVTYATHGNRDDLFPDTYTGNFGGGGGMAYDPSAEAMSDAKFAAMWNEAKKYLGYPYVWGGSSPSTSFDCSGFVCWVINHSGVGSVGRTTADGLTGYCTRVNKADAKPGDIIFFQGTYNTSGASHVGIVVGDGKMVHCGNPIQVTFYETSYWQAHFMAIGRLR